MILALSESLKILSHHGIEVVCNQLAVGTLSWVLLSVQEPFWNVVFSWSSNDVVDCLDLRLRHLSRSLVSVNLSDFKCEDSKSSTDTLNLSKTEWGLLFTVNVCVLNSQNMSEFLWILQYQ